MTVTVIVPTYKPDGKFFQLMNMLKRTNLQGRSYSHYEYGGEVLEKQFYGRSGQLGGTSSFPCSV